MAKARLTSPLRVAIYARVSSDEQASKEFSSVEVQEAVCRRWIEASGYVFAGCYSDEARTGTSLARPGFKKLLADGQAGCFDAISVTYMSRLGRGRAYHNAEYELLKTQIKVLTVEEKFTDDFAGQMNKDTKIFVEGMFPRLISQHTRTKQKEMVERGFHTGGTVPFGYQSVIADDGVGFRNPDKNPPKRLIPNDEQAPLVARAHDLFIETSSFTRVQDYLSGVTGERWTLNRVISLLQRETYTGVLSFGEWRNERAYPPIVDRKTWEAVQALIASRPREARRNREKETVPFYLRGHVYCAACGNRLTPAGHHGSKSFVKYYECQSSTRRIKPCPVKRVNADSLHQSVLEEIRRGAEHPTRLTELIREAVKELPEPQKMEAELGALAKRTREADKKIKNLMGVMEAGGGGVRSLITRLQELEEERAALSDERRRVEAKQAETRLARPNVAEVQALWGGFLRLWEKATEEERCQLLPLLVERVEMTEKERGFCDLAFQSQNPRSLIAPLDGNVLVNSCYRAGAGLEPATSGL